MSDFRVHPVLRTAATSPAVAAVVFGIVGAGLFDVGIADGLRAAGESKIAVDDWGVFTEARWGVEAISALLAGFSWWVLFWLKREQIKVPAAGIVLAVLGTVMGSVLIWSLLRSIHLPEFEAAITLTWRFAALWSGLVALSIVGSIRIGLWSYLAIRGVA
jgi:hypothetical protein